MAYQYPLNGGRINASVGGNSTSAGAGYQLVSTGTLHLAGGNNVTLSQNANSISIAGPTLSNSNGFTFGTNASVVTASYNGLISQSNQALSASNGSFAFQTAGFSNANGVTFGTSAGSIMTASVNTSYAASNHSHGNPALNLTNLTGTTASASNGLTLSLSAAAQSNQTLGFSAGSNTTLTSSGTLDARSLYINGAGNVSVGMSGGSIQISGSGGGGGVALSAAGGSITSGTASVAAGGALTASMNGQTLSLNAPATSILSALGGISISTTGSTIAFSADGGANVQTMNYYQNMDRGTTATLAVPFANSLMLQRLNQENDLFAGNITANTVLLNMTANLNSTATTAHTVSAYIGIYTDNATNLSLLNSASSTWALAGGNNTSVYNGPRWLSFVSSQWSSAPVFTQGGDYVFGILMKSSSFAPPLSYIGQNYMLSNQRSGYIGASIATNTSMAQGNFWNAVMATASLPSSINSTQANRNNASAIFMPHIILNNRYSSL